MQKEARRGQKLENRARSKRNSQLARGKIKREQGAQGDEKGAVKIGKQEQAAKIEGNREHGVKC